MVRERWGWAVVTAATGTVLIGVGAFWLSFMALADLAARSGITSAQAWIWPLLVDGLIVVSTIAVVALDGRTGAWYPWALLICGALVSVAANALRDSRSGCERAGCARGDRRGRPAAGAAGQHAPDRRPDPLHVAAPDRRHRLQGRGGAGRW